MGTSVITRTTTILLLIISLYRTSYAEETHHRRSPLGFQGVRGKRTVTTDDVPVTTITTSVGTGTAVDTKLNDNNYSIIQKEPVFNSEKFYKDNNDYGLQPKLLSVVKRAPRGFMGMRGKKDNEYTEFFDKRALLGFQGVRDKKFFLNLPLRFIPKRAPSGFMGMRGKKFTLTGDPGLDYYSFKRAPSGFMGMRGKKDSQESFNGENGDDVFTNHLSMDSSNNKNNNDVGTLSDDSDFYEGLQNEKQLLAELSHLYSNSVNDPEDYQKRAPAAGGAFFGMRGKKDFNDVNDDGDFNDFDKRAPSGFMGMRGKKWSEAGDMIDDGLMASSSFEQDKRAPSGFMGMRGKKDVTNVLSNDLMAVDSNEIKRAPVAGFFGMRGKKQPMGTNFFGMRGKKGPYEFRGKFVGVRGKKIPDHSALRKLAMDLGDIEADELKSAALMPNELFAANKRLGPSGFLGMRGKKWTESSSTEQQ